MKKMPIILIALGIFTVWSSAIFKLKTEIMVSEHGFREQISSSLKKRCNVTVIWSDVVFNTDPKLSRPTPENWQSLTLKTGVPQTVVLEHINRSEIVHIGRGISDGRSKIMFETSQGFEFNVASDDVSIPEIMPESTELKLAGDIYHWHNFKLYKVTGSWDTYGLNPVEVRYFLPFSEMKNLAYVAIVRNYVKFLIPTGVMLTILGLLITLRSHLRRKFLKRKNVRTRHDKKLERVVQYAPIDTIETAPVVYPDSIMPTRTNPHEPEVRRQEVRRESAIWISDNQREFHAIKAEIQEMIKRSRGKTSQKQRQSLLNILLELESGKRSVTKARFLLQKARKIFDENKQNLKAIHIEKDKKDQVYKGVPKPKSDESADLPLLSGREIINVLANRFGYKEVRKPTSHRRMTHDNRNNVSVPLHREVGRSLLKKILSDAKITPKEFKNASTHSKS